MKRLFTFLLCMATFVSFAQTLVSETTEQDGNLIINSKTFDDGTTEHYITTVESVTTDLTNWLLSQADCGFSGGCETIILGCCQGDGLDSSTNDGICTFPEFQDYVCTVDLELVWNTFRLEHCRFTMLNGTSIINNGIEIVESTFCDVGDEVTEYIFEGGGLEFANREEYDEYFNTLSIETVEQNNIKPLKEIYYDMLGKQINIQYASSGIYLKRSFYPNNLVEVTKVRK